MMAMGANLRRVTVLEGIQKSADFLQKKGVDSPRLHAELLLAHILKLPRMKLYLNFERALTDSETDALRDAVRRRGTREPLQHIVGSTSFCGTEISVSRHVLVPRPETELLAEAGWTFLAQRPSPTAIDFGTGSGCISIAIALKCPLARLIALDISMDALQVARKNAQESGVGDRIDFVLGDGLQSLPPEIPAVDLIISNPPYIPSAEIPTLHPEVRDFDPNAALDGGADGLRFYRHLLEHGRKFLNPDGQLMAEFGDGQGDALRILCTEQNWIVEQVGEDYSQRERFLIARPA